MPEVSTGDRVRVSYEGEVLLAAPWRTGDVHIGTRYRVRRADGITSTFGVRARESSIVVEVIEPGYEDGDIVVDADGDYFRYDADDNTWEEFGSEYTHPFGYPARPLVKLVRIDN
jgi:hypothetical protein